MNMAPHKHCPDCNTTKPASEFSPHKTTADKLQTYCRVCSKKRAAQWNRDNPERYHISRAAARSRERGWPRPTITVEHLRSIRTDACKACGVYFTNDNGPTLDCIDPAGPYRPGNVAFICRRCNISKLDSTADDLHAKADAALEAAGLTGRVFTQMDPGGRLKMLARYASSPDVVVTGWAEIAEPDVTPKQSVTP